MDVNKGLAPGTMLHGAYRIERILGQGGFGITYLAYEIRLERHVAIKEFFPQDYCDRESTTSQVTLGTDNTKAFVESLKAKFLREGKNIVKFDHPGIIKVHTAFEENGTAYYVMDYIEGWSLSQLVKKRIEERRGPLPEKEALRYIGMVGEALEYLHSHSMNHFDVKPANILVRTVDDRPILIDFGLSKQYDTSSRQATATVMGMSQGYAPMEQYAAGGVKEFSPQTDLYALAATLYYLLAGTAPPEAPSLAEQELMFPASIPVRLIEPISKAMAWRRLDRHPTVRAFLEDLETTDTKPQPQHEEERTEISLPKEVSEVHEESEQSAEKTPGDSKRRYTWIWFPAAVAIALAVWFIAFHDWKADPAAPQAEEGTGSSPAPQEVEGLLWESPLGRCVYSGTVLTDNATGEQIPDGKGVAKILGGDYGGCTYDGEFKNGVLEGRATYTYRDGDTFEGTFVNNEYSEGKYTVKESGEYFEGTFKNGKPDSGTWYDRKGNKIE